jgi:hypothetical protein
MYMKLSVIISVGFNGTNHLVNSDLTLHNCYLCPPVMLRCVAPVRNNISEERSASIIRVTRISLLGTTLAVTSNRCMLIRNTM